MGGNKFISKIAVATQLKEEAAVFMIQHDQRKWKFLCAINRAAGSSAVKAHQKYVPYGFRYLSARSVQPYNHDAYNL
jgi:hypothetical protein